MGKHSFVSPSANNTFGRPVFNVSKTEFHEHWHTHTLFRGQTINPSKTETPSPQIPIFIVFCYLHLYMKAQLLEAMSTRRVKNGPLFRHPTRILTNTITETHIIPQLAEVTSETSKGSETPVFAGQKWRGLWRNSHMDSGVSLFRAKRWIVWKLSSKHIYTYIYIYAVGFGNGAGFCPL